MYNSVDEMTSAIVYIVIKALLMYRIIFLNFFFGIITFKG